MTDKTEKPYLVLSDFPGFYESWLSSEFDSMVERESEYYLNDVLEVPDSVKPELWDCWRYGDYERQAAEHWLEALKTWADNEMSAPDDLESHARALIESLECESISSPRYYNFTTDRLFATFDPVPMRAIWDMALQETTFAQLVYERHRSRDGFASYYPHDVTEWPEFEELDHNHLATVFKWLLDECDLDTGDESFFYEYMEGLSEVASNSCDYEDSRVVEAVATAALESDDLESVETVEELESSPVFQWARDHLTQIGQSRHYCHFEDLGKAIAAKIFEAIPQAVIAAYDNGLEIFARCPATLDLFNEESTNA